ncbi:hypothetical protein Droror1_Dr00012359 [Drosera rotundifolia]
MGVSEAATTTESVNPRFVPRFTQPHSYFIEIDLGGKEEGERRARWGERARRVFRFPRDFRKEEERRGRRRRRRENQDAGFSFFLEATWLLGQRGIRGNEGLRFGLPLTKLKHTRSLPSKTPPPPLSLPSHAAAQFLPARLPPPLKHHTRLTLVSHSAHTCLLSIPVAASPKTRTSSPVEPCCHASCPGFQKRISASPLSIASLRKMVDAFMAVRPLPNMFS